MYIHLYVMRYTDYSKFNHILSRSHSLFYKWEKLRPVEMCLPMDVK